MTGSQRRQRIVELRTELRELEATPRSDWHAAFEAILRIETHGCPGVEIRTETEIGYDAPRADFVILTRDDAEPLSDPVFGIFRSINVLEYKRPDDALNERTLYTAAGYASLLIGTAEREGDVPPDEVTVSVFRARRNPVLFTRMEEAGELVRTDVPGVYRVLGLIKLPFQVVVTSELEGDSHAAFRALTDRAELADVARVIRAADRETDEAVRDYYGSLIELVLSKNPQVADEIGRDDTMEDVLMEILKDRVEEKLTAQKRDVTVAYLTGVVANLGVGLDAAMDAFGIPQDQRGTYEELVAGRMG